MTERVLVTIDSLRSCGWHAALAGSPNSYDELTDAFRAEAEKAKTAGEEPRFKVLVQLAAICSMGLEPSDRGQPFRPEYSLRDRRTFLPEDREDAELAALAQFSGEVTNCLLKARLADLGWVSLRPRSQDYARTAIDAYCTTPLDGETWHVGGRQIWTRALVLCREIKKSAGERLQSIEERLIQVVLDDGAATAMLRCSVSELLREYRLGWDARSKIAERLEQEARACLEQKDPITARHLFLAAAKWYELASRHEDFARTTSAVAEAWVGEGKLFEGNATGGGFAATSHYRCALEQLQRIPWKYREPFGVNARIRDLRRRITECQERDLEQMLGVESSLIDIAKAAADAR